MMGACPLEAMAGAYGDMMAACHQKPLLVDMSMLTQIPVEAVAEVIGLTCHQKP